MKWKELFTVNEEAKSITFIQSDITCSFSDIVKVEVVTLKVQKEVSKEILNSIANAMTNSIANGDEYMHVNVRVQFADDSKIDIQLSEDRVLRFSDAYNEQVRIARKVQTRLRELRNMKG